MGKNPTTGTVEMFPDYVPMAYERRRLPRTLSSLRRALGHKAKREPKFRFYSLYGQIYRQDVLQAAWHQVQRKDGAPGPDGISINQIVDSEGGAAGFLDDLGEELRTKRYKPGAVRRVHIPKPDGRTRPLGIPNVRDRVVQTALYLILEPIYEVDFLPCSYGFRPGRSAHDALKEIREHIEDGYREVYDADMKGYFDSIPHDNLIKGLQQRISDRSVLKLIRSWLKSPVLERTEKGVIVHRMVAGTPQGGVISPLLANSYLHWFDRAFHSPTGPARWANAKLVRYADDFVVMARYQGGRLVAWIEDTLEKKMGLTINRDKTKVVNLREGARLDFLGYSFQYHRDLKGRSRRYLNVYPSKKALGKERAELKRKTSSRYCFMPIAVLIRSLNEHLDGWMNYFSFGYPRKTYRNLRWYLLSRMRNHLERRSQRPYRPPKGTNLEAHLKRIGLAPKLL